MTNWAETLRKGVFWECKSYKINIKGVKEVGGSQSPNCLKKNCSTLGGHELWSRALPLKPARGKPP